MFFFVFFHQSINAYTFNVVRSSRVLVVHSDKRSVPRLIIQFRTLSERFFKFIKVYTTDRWGASKLLRRCGRRGTQEQSKRGFCRGVRLFRFLVGERVKYGNTRFVRPPGERSETKNARPKKTYASNIIVLTMYAVD